MQVTPLIAQVKSDRGGISINLKRELILKLQYKHWILDEEEEEEEGWSQFR